MPSTWPEAFGKIGIEAMSVGRPVIATDVGGISDWLIDGKTGYLINPNDSDSLSDAVVKIFSDTDKLLSMSKDARLQSLDFSLEKYADRMEAIHRDLIQSYEAKNKRAL